MVTHFQNQTFVPNHPFYYGLGLTPNVGLTSNQFQPNIMYRNGNEISRGWPTESSAANVVIGVIAFVVFLGIAFFALVFVGQGMHGKRKKRGATEGSQTFFEQSAEMSAQIINKIEKGSQAFEDI